MKKALFVLGVLFGVTSVFAQNQANNSYLRYIYRPYENHNDVYYNFLLISKNAEQFVMRNALTTGVFSATSYKFAEQLMQISPTGLYQWVNHYNYYNYRKNEGFIGAYVGPNRNNRFSLSYNYRKKSPKNFYTEAIYEDRLRAFQLNETRNQSWEVRNSSTIPFKKNRRLYSILLAKGNAKTGNGLNIDSLRAEEQSLYLRHQLRYNRSLGSIQRNVYLSNDWFQQDIKGPQMIGINDYKGSLSSYLERNFSYISFKGNGSLLYQQIDRNIGKEKQSLNYLQGSGILTTEIGNRNYTEKKYFLRLENKVNYHQRLGFQYLPHAIFQYRKTRFKGHAFYRRQMFNPGFLRTFKTSFLWNGVQLPDLTYEQEEHHHAHVSGRYQFKTRHYIQAEAGYQYSPDKWLMDRSMQISRMRFDVQSYRMFYLHKLNNVSQFQLSYAYRNSSIEPAIKWYSDHQIGLNAIFQWDRNFGNGKNHITKPTLRWSSTWMSSYEALLFDNNKPLLVDAGLYSDFFIDFLVRLNYKPRITFSFGMTNVFEAGPNLEIFNSERGLVYADFAMPDLRRQWQFGLRVPIFGWY